MKAIIPREEWGALPAKSQDPLKTPVEMLLMMDTQSEECNAPEDCKKIVKELQRVYMEEKGFDDIPWSFMIGGDGNVYEGRGWKNKSFKTDLTNKVQKTYDGVSLDFAYIGNFKKKLPKLATTDVVKDLIVSGMDAKHIQNDFDIENLLATEGVDAYTKIE